MKMKDLKQNKNYRDIQKSTKELKKLITNKNARIIDIRQVEAYNGWQLKNEKRGGHIAGAKSLPAKWLNYIDWIEIVRHKNILPENEIVVYGYSPKETQKVAERFEKSGYKKVSVYPHFMDEWTANTDLPMHKLERYKNLVSAEWVNELISGRKPAEYDNDDFVLVHAHYRNRDAYLSGHIPGAIDINTNDPENPFETGLPEENLTPGR